MCEMQPEINFFPSHAVFKALTSKEGNLRSLAKLALEKNLSAEIVDFQLDLKNIFSDLEIKNLTFKRDFTLINPRASNIELRFINCKFEGNVKFSYVSPVFENCQFKGMVKIKHMAKEYVFSAAQCNFEGKVENQRISPKFKSCKAKRKVEIDGSSLLSIEDCTFESSLTILGHRNFKGLINCKIKRLHFLYSRGDIELSTNHIDYLKLYSCNSVTLNQDGSGSINSIGMDYSNVDLTGLKFSKLENLNFISSVFNLPSSLKLIGNLRLEFIRDPRVEIPKGLRIGRIILDYYINEKLKIFIPEEYKLRVQAPKKDRFLGDKVKDIIKYT